MHWPQRAEDRHNAQNAGIQPAPRPSLGGGRECVGDRKLSLIARICPYLQGLLRVPLPVDAPDTRPVSYAELTQAHVAPAQKDLMAEGYCVKCKAKKEIADAVEVVTKNGRKAIKGKCPTCGVGMFKTLGVKADPPAGTPPPAAPSTPQA